MELNQQTLDFIEAHAGKEVARLTLQYAGKNIPGVDMSLALTQIEARNKAGGKLPWLTGTPAFIFPDALSAEQCTAQCVADYHRQIAGTPESLLDLTCGLGIDAMTIGADSSRCLACDISPAHAECARHNAALRGLAHFEVRRTDSESLLKSLTPGERFSLIFADPARRSGSGSRTYALSDCSPDITALMPLISEHTDRLMVKVSPMLDVTKVMLQMPSIRHIHAVSLRGECKELLLDCDMRRNSPGKVSFSAVDIDATGVPHIYSFADADKGSCPKVPIASATEIETAEWIFEPNASLMKFIHYAPLAGRWPCLRKMAANTYLYVAEGPIPAGMPGRALRIKGMWNAYRHCAGSLPAQVNIVTRNFPDQPQLIKKKLKIKDGGDEFLYCCRSEDKRTRFLLCTTT